jgi:hypothetical protein
MEEFTKACSRMIRMMEKENYSFQTVIIIKACGGKVYLLVKAGLITAMEAFLMVICPTTVEKERGSSMVLNNSLDSGSTQILMDLNLNLNS